MQLSSVPKRMFASTRRAALSFRLAETKFNQRFNEMLANIIPLDGQAFWIMASAYRTLVIANQQPKHSRYFFDRPPADNYAAIELFAEFDFDDVIRFVCGYRDIIPVFHSHLEKALNNRDEPVFNVLLDAMPLVGGDFYKLCIGGQITDSEFFEQQVVRQTEGKYYSLCNGNHYFNLVNAAKTAFIQQTAVDYIDKAGQDTLKDLEKELDATNENQDV